jgi:hypothetical protein
MTSGDFTSGRHPDRAGAGAPSVVTLALFGAGGHVVGPRVAERLGVPYLDRGILAGVAKQMHVPESAVAGYDPESQELPHSPLRRYFYSLGHMTTADASPASSLEFDDDRYRIETEEFLAKATTEGGVVLGRGGQVVLRAVPGVLHVLLHGHLEAPSGRACGWSTWTGRPPSGVRPSPIGRGARTSGASTGSTRRIPTCTTWSLTARPSTWAPASS